MTFGTTRGKARGIALLGALCLAAALVVPGAGGETVRQGSLQVSFGGSVAPHLLPRTGTTPIAVTIRGSVRALTAAAPPSLRRIAIEVNRLGVLERSGLPACPLQRLRASSTETAVRGCRGAIVGEGQVSGVLVLPEQDPTPFGGRVVAFNGTMPDGRPAILAHLYTTLPAPLTFVLAFSIGHAHGTFGTRLVATVPAKTRRTAHITSFTLRLHRTYTVDGERRSYLSAGCPAPEGFPSVTFPLVRTAYGFVGEKTVADTLVRTCEVRSRRLRGDAEGERFRGAAWRLALAQHGVLTHADLVGLGFDAKAIKHRIGSRRRQVRARGLRSAAQPPAKADRPRPLALRHATARSAR